MDQKEIVKTYPKYKCLKAVTVNDKSFKKGTSYFAISSSTDTDNIDVYNYKGNLVTTISREELEKNFKLNTSFGEGETDEDCRGYEGEE